MAISCWKTLFILGENRGKTVFAFLWLSRVSCQPEITRGRKEIRQCDIKGGLALWKPEAWLLLGKNTGSDCTGAIRSLGLCLKFTITRSPVARSPVSKCLGCWREAFGKLGKCKDPSPRLSGIEYHHKSGQPRWPARSPPAPLLCGSKPVWIWIRASLITVH